MSDKTIIYTKTGCPYCAAAKDDLKKRAVQYDEINLTENPKRISEIVKLTGGRNVPVIVTGEKVSVGFAGGS